MKQIADLETLYRSDAKKACQVALKLTKNIATNDRLEAINKLLHGYGTEAIRGNWQNGYWGDIVAVYVNMGDTYNTTVIQVRTGYGSRFIVTDYGEFIERNETKLGIF